MDFRETVIDALDRLIASPVITEAIDKAIRKCVEEVIQSELRSYSDFGKRLTEAVKRSLQFTEDFDLPSYNHAILQIVRKQVAGMTEATIQQQVAKNLETLLAPAPESIKLSELVEKFVEQVRRDFDEGESFEITARVRPSDHGFRYIELDKSPNAAKHCCDIELGVTRDNEIFSLSFRSADVEKQMFAGSIYGLQRLLFQMRAAKSRVEFDIDPCEIQTEYGPAYD